MRVKYLRKTAENVWETTKDRAKGGFINNKVLIFTKQIKVTTLEEYNS